VSQASKILIIDDDWGTCEMISDVLRLKGYSVETAGLGQEGLEMLRSRPFNAAIVDIKLPDISGVDLLWVMKEASPGIEVIFITGHASLTSAIQAVSGNAFAYLTKPFETNHLLTTLDKALEKQRLATENQRLYQATMQELAERKRVEEQLKQSNVELARSEKALRKSLSDLKESHEELKEAQLQLIQAEKLESVSSLAAGVAHEVKNPLAIILQGLNYLSKRLPTDGDNAAIAIHDMEDAVKRADSVVKRLLDFSATSELSLATEELNSVVEQSLLLVKHELDKYHVNVVRELSESLPPVKLVRNKIEQVFINIFLNAIHAMPKGGTLTVKTYAKQLTEAKHNVGSREADHFRIGETVVMAEVGTGLGLTVTKKIIDLHGGTIDIGNRQGGGVKVTIMFKARGGNEHE
jgi:signal transduction histidine kinase